VFAFTGKLYDENTKLQNNLNRWYDPTIGQWMNEDPIGFAAGDENVRRYVGNNSLRLVDPTGLEPPHSVMDRRTAILHHEDNLSDEQVNRLVKIAREVVIEGITIGVTVILSGKNGRGRGRGSPKGGGGLGHPGSMPSAPSAPIKPQIVGQPGTTVVGLKQSRRYGDDASPKLTETIPIKVAQNLKNKIIRMIGPMEKEERRDYRKLATHHHQQVLNKK